MTTADIAAFHKRFVTLKTLVSEVGEYRNTILAQFKVSGVHPFSPVDESFGLLYVQKPKSLPASGPIFNSELEKRFYQHVLSLEK